MNKTVLLAAPLQNRSWILPYYLEKIHNLVYDKSLITLYFIVNNTTDNSEEILLDFKNKYINEYKNIIIEKYDSDDYFEDERTNETRQKYTYGWLSHLRNKILKKCVTLNCDYLFSCDSDILVSPNTLKELIETEKDICASLIYNGYLFSPKEPYKYPNILYLENGRYKHIVNYYVKNPDKCPKDKLIEVDATGAICLISKKVCSETIYFSDPQGEDISWSKMCQDRGYKLYCKPSLFNSHIMSPTLLEKFI